MKGKLCWEDGNPFEADSIESLYQVVLFPQATNSHVQEIPHTFPNLGALELWIPSVDLLRTTVKIMASLRLRTLKLRVGYVFESTLITALRGQPFEIVTDSDKAMLEKLKEYKFWERFAKHLNIEIPTEKERELVNTNADTVSEFLASEPTSVSIGSLKNLKNLEVSNLRRDIYLPNNNLHWNDPDVKLCTEPWTPTPPEFPACILLDELTKLKGTLVNLNLSGFRKNSTTNAEFQERMGLTTRIRFSSGADTKWSDNRSKHLIDRIRVGGSHVPVQVKTELQNGHSTLNINPIVN